MIIATVNKDGPYYEWRNIAQLYEYKYIRMQHIGFVLDETTLSVYLMKYLLCLNLIILVFVNYPYFDFKAASTIAISYVPELTV